MFSPDTCEFLITDFPPEAIEDCSGPGAADEAVDYWVDFLDFHPPTEKVRQYLRGFGCWDAQELEDADQNRRRFFWVMMCDFSEWDGTTESPCGSDCVYI